MTVTEPTSYDTEGDYEVVGVGQGSRPGGIVSVRLKADEMQLLVALSEVGGRTLSETLRLGLRYLAERPVLVTGTSGQALRLETRGSQAVTHLTTRHEAWSQPSAIAVVSTK
jgi:hypothetical protein